MKKFIPLFLLAIITNKLIVAQDTNIDSLKILKEVTALINKNNLEVNSKLSQIEEDIKLLTKEGNKRMSNDAISALIATSKSESEESTNELIADKEEKILKDVEVLISKANKILYDNIMQTIEEYKNKNSDDTQTLTAEIKDNFLKENNANIDKKSSEIYLNLSEKMEDENKALYQKIDEQNDLIIELQKRIKALELKMDSQNNN